MTHKSTLILTLSLGVLACARPAVIGADSGDKDQGDAEPDATQEEEHTAQEVRSTAEVVGAIPEQVRATPEAVRAVMQAHAQSAIGAGGTDRTVSQRAIRALGPEGLAAFLELHSERVERLRDGSFDSSAPEFEVLREAIDAIAQQRDAFASGLYWYTDLDAATQAAERSGRPILSLRLLGELDEELSCANSRLFRTVLYANESVSDFMRETFVMHWSSERPAPVVTIDMGDGRTLTRTITGNSAHYVLDSRGRFVDVLPGLYAPEPFIAALGRARTGALECTQEEDSAECVTRYHQQALVTMRAAWAALGTHTQAHSGGSLVADRGGPGGAWGQGLFPTLDTLSLGGPFLQSALAIDLLTIGKSMSEREILQMTELQRGFPQLDYDNAWWVVMSPFALCGDECERATLDDDRVLDDGARAMVRLKSGAGHFDEQLQSLFEATLQDSVRNEFVLHRDVHRWIMGSTETRTLEQVNTWLYENVFLTRPSDPWMGLNDPSAYDAIER